MCGLTFSRDWVAYAELGLDIFIHQRRERLRRFNRFGDYAAERFQVDDSYTTSIHTPIVKDDRCLGDVQRWGSAILQFTRLRRLSSSCMGQVLGYNRQRCD
jgi:hypothetical protein